MKKLLIIPLVFLFASCVTQKACDKKFPPQVNIIDSVSYREVLIPKDTLIKTFVEIVDTAVYDSTVYTFVGIPNTLAFKKLYLKGRFSEASAWVSGDKIKGELKEGGTMKLVFWLKYYEKRVETLKQQQKTEIKAAPSPTWWQRTWGKVKNVFAWIGVVATALGIFALVGVVRFTVKEFVL